MTKSIHIAIDGREANIKNRVGSNVYAFNIINSFYKLLKQYPQVKITILLAQTKTRDLPQANSQWQYQVFGPSKFWTQWALPIHLYHNYYQAKDRYTVFFTPSHYAPRLSPTPYITSVMDLAFLEYPQQFKKTDFIKLKSWTKYSVERATKVVAISNYTKNQIKKQYNKKSKDILIAYPASEIKKLKVTTTETKQFFKKHKIKKPYFLFVGTLQPRKNIIKLIEAFEVFNRMQAGRNLKKTTKKASNKLQKPQLILAGKIGWLADEIQEKIKTSPLHKQIITTGFISEKEKQLLYKHATATCLVGLYEGFGIPPLESLAFNTPVIVSNTTSLPEVVGKAGLLATPTKAKEIANQMYQASVMTTKQKQQFKKEAKKQLKKFSWDKSAKKILIELIKISK